MQKVRNELSKPCAEENQPLLQTLLKLVQIQSEQIATQGQQIATQGQQLNELVAVVKELTFQNAEMLSVIGTQIDQTQTLFEELYSMENEEGDSKNKPTSF